MNKIKTFTDEHGDTLELDPIAATGPGAYLFFTTFGHNEDPDDASTVLLDAEQVIALRKTLKKWLLANGHVEPKGHGPLVKVALTFDPRDLGHKHPLAVTLQDEEGRIHETVWER